MFPGIGECDVQVTELRRQGLLAEVAGASASRPPAPARRRPWAWVVLADSRAARPEPSSAPEIGAVACLTVR